MGKSENYVCGMRGQQVLLYWIGDEVLRKRQMRMRLGKNVEGVRGQ